MGFFFFQAEDGIRDIGVTGVQTCALPILPAGAPGCAYGLGTIGTSIDDGGLAYIRATTPSVIAHEFGHKIGRGSCRERVEISVVAVSLKKKKHTSMLCYSTLPTKSLSTRA